MMDRAFKYVKKNKLATEADYPYVAKGQSCAKKTGVVGVNGYVDVPVNNVDQLMAAVAQQPVSIAIQADSDVFQHYSSGVI